MARIYRQCGSFLASSLATLILWSVPITPATGAPPAVSGLLKSCVNLATAATELHVPETPVLKDPAVSDQRAIRPPSAQEIRDLADLLSDLSSKRSSHERLAQLARGKPFTFQRLAVLLGDSRAILAGIHARETLDGLGSIPDISPDMRQWMEGNLQVMIDCPRFRFEGRGGIDAFEQVRDIIERLRPRLDPYIFDSLSLDIDGPAGSERPQGEKQ